MGTAFWLESASVSALELGKAAGFPAAIIDMEHGAGMDPGRVDQLIAFCRAIGLDMWVRVSAPERVPVQHALDSGAIGVILPQVASAQHAALASAHAKYPPLGDRGIGYGRTMYGGVDQGFADSQNRRTKCLVMIETPGALSEVEAIAALDCVDGLFIGPADLSLTRGRGMVAHSEDDLADYRRVAHAARQAGKQWAMPATARRIADFARGEGASLIVVADDLTAMKNGFAAMREAVGDH